MAKKRRDGRARNRSARTIVRPRLSDPPLSLFGDRRQFHPDLVKPAFGVRVGATRLVVAPSRPRARAPRGVSFAVPKQVMVCVRRKRRREVIFAKGKQGGGNRRPRRNHWSDVSCR